MKRIHLTSLIILFLAVFTFSSCLDSDGGSGWSTLGDYMTFNSYTSRLTPDKIPYTLIPENPQILQVLDKENKPTGKYFERALIYFQLLEGEEFGQEGKNTYRVTIIGGSPLNVKEMKEDQESIKDSNPIWNFSSKKDGFWGTNGYVNVAFYPTYESGKENEFNINDFDLFFDKVSADNKVLYLRLNHSIPKVENFNYDSKTPFLTSFIFDSSKLEEKFPELETFGTANDSIRAQITALGLNGEDLKSPEFVIKLKK